jgi:hypothetical protein
MAWSTWKFVGMLAAMGVGLGGCAATARTEMQTISAGHTGCVPADNQLSNVMVGGTWNATCKGKTYLCSASGASSYSCAPVAE